jgi:outer membrane protein X
MKKVLFVALAIAMISISSVNAQSYKPFKVGLGFLYAVPTGEGAGGGIGFYLEPKYNINDKFDAGLLIESALLAQAATDLTSASISGVTSYSITGDYMLGSGKVRPFIGTGIGIYSLGSIDVPTDINMQTGAVTTASYSLGSKFGFSPRVGINLSHFQIELQYHIITGQDKNLMSKNYLAIKMGIEFGGGLK